MKFEFTKAEEKLLELPIEDLNLSVRAYNCLRAANIIRMRELLTYTTEELAEFRMFGQKSIAEIEYALEKIGLSLRNRKYMKLELVKQIDPIKDEIWYIVRVDTDCQYFTNESDARKKYETLIKLKSKEKKEIVLEFKEINLSL